MLNAKATLTLALLASAFSLQPSAFSQTTMAHISQELATRPRTNGTYTVDQVVDGKTNKITYQEIVIEQAPVQVIRLLIGDYTPVLTNRVAVTTAVAQIPLLSTKHYTNSPTATNSPAVDK